MSKLLNEYVEAFGDDSRFHGLYADMPKAVWAAIAISALTQGGDFLEEAKDRVLEEWWCLFEAGVVPQKPTLPRPKPKDLP